MDKQDFLQALSAVVIVILLLAGLLWLLIFSASKRIELDREQITLCLEHENYQYCYETIYK